MFRIAADLEDLAVKKLLAWLRFKHHDGKPIELKEYADKYLDGEKTKVISLDNETKVWTSVQDLVRQ